jgi:glutamine amidotransferase
MKVAIVKYNAGNNRSVLNALERLGVSATVTDDPGLLQSADKVIFPGVGEASSAMNYLRQKKLDDTIRSLTQPVLGVCLGMQLLCEHSEENDTQCLGIVPGRVRRFANTDLKVPHMGWNSVSEMNSSLFDGVPDNSYAYFVHGFYVERSSDTVASTNYGTTFAAAMNYKNYYAVQFHPEKSGVVGEQILKNFLDI